MLVARIPPNSTFIDTGLNANVGPTHFACGRLDFYFGERSSRLGLGYRSHQFLHCLAKLSFSLHDDLPDALSSDSAVRFANLVKLQPFTYARHQNLARARLETPHGLLKDIAVVLEDHPFLCGEPDLSKLLTRRLE